MKRKNAFFAAVLAMFGAAIPAFAGDVQDRTIRVVNVETDDLGPEPATVREILDIEVRVPNKTWDVLQADQIPGPLLATGTQVIIASPNNGALVLIAKLQAEPRLVSAQAASMCASLSREAGAKTSRAVVVSVSYRYAYCAVENEKGKVWRASVLQLGPNRETQIRLVSVWDKGDIESVVHGERVIESLRLRNP